MKRLTELVMQILEKVQLGDLKIVFAIVSVFLADITAALTSHKYFRNRHSSLCEIPTCTTGFLNYFLLTS